MNGIINIKKEKGYTSFDVVAKMRGILKMKKIGHTGTLDPDATGVLPVCIGKATRVCDLLTDKDKVYETRMLLGRVTDTQDITGQVLQENPVTVSVEQVKSCILSFVGNYEQIPPMYSALKVNGQKLCELARKGIEVERKARPVTIYDIEILDVDIPYVSMRVHCSKGTYIRTLCDDIGQKLGCGACMAELVRTRVADFMLEDAVTLAQLEQAVTKNCLEEYVKPVDYVFAHCKEIVVREEFRKLLYNGNKLPVSCGCYEGEAEDGDRLRVYDAEKKFVGIYEYQAGEELLKPVKLFLE
ncbi:MAG: tRNA pseudouridine(55) synthase TruB [Lachnospiraceae bacterium]|nr:tRNA pseudouridine(55) synthase TruB [Lachnospiraceae bacterium]